MDPSEVKAVIRGILISNPSSMTVKDLGVDFRKNEGMEIPFVKFGFNSLLDFLKSIPDTVVLDSSSRYNPVVTPVKNEMSSHVDSLVMKQKVSSNNKKRFQFRSTPGRRKQAVQMPKSLMETIIPKPVEAIERNVSIPPLANKSLDEFYISFNTNKNSEKVNQNSMHSYKVTPTHIVNLLNHLCSHPQGCSFVEAERVLLSDFKAAKINGIQDIIFDLQNYFDIHNNRIYQKDRFYNKVSTSNDHTVVSTKSGMTATDIAAATVRATDISPAGEKCNLPRWAPVSEAIYIPAGAESSMLNRSYSDLSDCGSNVSDSSRRNTCIKGNEKVDNSEVDEEDDGVESWVSSKIKANLKQLIIKYPDGIYCCDLPALYEKEFNSTLNYEDYGYDCVINMVSDLKSVFTLKRENRNSDWKLFNSSLRKRESFIEDDVKKWVSREIIENIRTVLANNPKGLPYFLLCSKYLEYHKKSLNVESIGFVSLESLLDNMSDHIHQRKVKDKILLYVKDENFNPDYSDLKRPFEELQLNLDVTNDALPSDEKLKPLFSGLYPEEVCGPDDTFQKQKLPEITNRFFEVRVSEVSNPHQLWVQLGSEYHKLERMMIDLEEFYCSEEYNYKMPDMTIKSGQVCACPYGESINQNWHRSVVVNTMGAVKVKIEYVDYGTVSIVPKSNLRFLHKDFLDLPVQGILAKLASILPPEGYKKWPLETNSKLLEMVFDKRLYFEACNIDYEEFIIEGVLYDTNGKEDIVINDYLANNGFAKFIPLTDLESFEKNTVGEVDDWVYVSKQRVNCGTPDKERCSISPKSERSPLNTTADSGSAGSVVPDFISKKYPEIQSNVMDLPYGKKELDQSTYAMPLNKAVQSSYAGAGNDTSGISTPCRPPPGFIPLNNNGTGGISGQENLRLPVPNVVPSLHPQPPVLPPKMNNNLDLLMNILASSSINPTTSSLLQMYSGYQHPPLKPNNFNSFQEANAPSWNNFPSAAAPNWYNGPSQSSSAAPPYRQIRPTPPMFFPQASLNPRPSFFPTNMTYNNNSGIPSTNVPFPTHVAGAMPYNYNNYNLQSPYLQPQKYQQPVYPWPSVNNLNNAPLLPSSLTSTVGTLPQQVAHKQDSPVKCKTVTKENTSTRCVDDRPKQSPTEANQINSNSKDCVDSFVCNSKNQSELLSIQSKLSEVIETSSGRSTLMNDNSCETSAGNSNILNSDMINVEDSDAINSYTCESKIKEVKDSLSVKDDTKKELSQNCTTISKKKSTKASKAKKECEKKSTALQTIVEEKPTIKLSGLSLLTNSNNNPDDVVVDSWEELADDNDNNIEKNKNISNKNNNSNKNSKNINTINNNSNNKSNSSNNTNNNNNNASSKNSAKSKKQKDKQSKNTSSKKTNSSNNNVKVSSSSMSTSKNSISYATSHSSTTSSASQKLNVSKKTKKDTTETKISSAGCDWIWGNSNSDSFFKDGNNTKKLSEELSIQSLIPQSQEVLCSNDNESKICLENNIKKTNFSSSASSKQLSSDTQLIDNSVHKAAECDGVENKVKSHDNDASVCSALNYSIDSVIRKDMSVVVTSTFENPEVNCESNKESVISVQNPVLKKVVCGKPVHLILVTSSDDNKIVIVTDEIVKHFTSFSKRYSVLKLLDFKQIEKPFYDLHKKNLPDLFKHVERFSIEAVQKAGGPVPDKLNVLPLESVPNLLKALNGDQSVIDGLNVIIDEIKGHNIHVLS